MIGTEIKFTVDNFSGIIDCKEWLEYMKNNNLHHKHQKRKMVKTNMKGIYILYDKLKAPIYIGKAETCIRQRLRSHLKAAPKSIDEYENLYTMYKRANYKYFSFIETEKEFSPFLEYYLINKYKPKFNKQYNSDFKIDEKWNSFLEKNKTKKMINEEKEIEGIYNSL